MQKNKLQVLVDILILIQKLELQSNFTLFSSSTARESLSSRLSFKLPIEANSASISDLEQYPLVKEITHSDIDIDLSLKIIKKQGDHFNVEIFSKTIFMDEIKFTKTISDTAANITERELSYLIPIEEASHFEFGAYLEADLILPQFFLSTDVGKIRQMKIPPVDRTTQAHQVINSVCQIFDNLNLNHLIDVETIHRLVNIHNLKLKDFSFKEFYPKLEKDKTSFSLVQHIDEDSAQRNKVNAFDISTYGYVMYMDNSYPVIFEKFEVFGENEAHADSIEISEATERVTRGRLALIKTEFNFFNMVNDRDTLKKYTQETRENFFNKLNTKWVRIIKALEGQPKEVDFLILEVLHNFIKKYLNIFPNWDFYGVTSFTKACGEKPKEFFVAEYVYGLDLNTFFGVSFPKTYFDSFYNIDFTIKQAKINHYQKKIDKIETLTRLSKSYDYGYRFDSKGVFSRIAWPIENCLQGLPTEYEDIRLLKKNYKESYLVINDTNLSETAWKNKLRLVYKNGDYVWDAPQSSFLILTPNSKFEGVKLKRFLKHRPNSFLLSNLISEFKKHTPTVKKIGTKKEKVELNKEMTIDIFYPSNSKPSRSRVKLGIITNQKFLYLKYKNSKRLVEFTKDKWVEETKALNRIEQWNKLIGHPNNETIVLINEKNLKILKEFKPDITMFEDFVTDTTNVKNIRKLLNKYYLIEGGVNNYYLLDGVNRIYQLFFRETRILSKYVADEDNPTLLNDLRFLFLNIIFEKVGEQLQDILAEILKRLNYHVAEKSSYSTGAPNIVLPTANDPDFHLFKNIIGLDQFIFNKSDIELLQSFASQLSTITEEHLVFSRADLELFEKLRQDLTPDEKKKFINIEERLWLFKIESLFKERLIHFCKE